jgi:uncharacterized protein YjbJ (UPF0337 family)
MPGENAWSHRTILADGGRREQNKWHSIIDRIGPSRAPSKAPTGAPSGLEYHHMNWDQVEGKWKQVKGSIKQKWGNLTDDDLDYIAGSRDKLAGKLQERYGLANEEAQKRADEWLKALKDIAPTKS